MDSSNAEKAWDEYASALPGMLRPAEVNALRPHFMAGRASRDAEVAELTSRLRWDVAAARVEAFTTESDTFRARGEALVKQISELRAALGDSEARRAELEAVIEKVRDWNTLTNGRPRYRECDDIIAGDKCWWPDVDGGGSWFPHDFCDGTCANCFRQEESVSSPSVVLEDRDREVAARAVESVAHMLETGSTNPAGKYGSLNEGSRSQWFSHGLREATDRVRERAAAIRKGDTNA